MNIALELLIRQLGPLGNKRVAFFATDIFLRLNGWKIAVDAQEAHRFTAHSTRAP